MPVVSEGPAHGHAPALEVRGIVKTYRLRGALFQPKRTLTALGSVDLAVQRGESVGIVGESGCGKSTLAKIMLGLLAPDSGEVLMNGRPLAAMGRLEIGRHVQPILQDPYSSLNPRKCLGDIIALPLVLHSGKTKTEIREEVLAMLETVGLSRGYAQRYPNQLSGGQRQRVAIARALILKPSLVICDEPTSALDVSVQAQIINLLIDLQNRLGLAYVFISHNLAVVEHLCTRVAVMQTGQIVEEADTDRLFRRPQHPYTRTLLDAAMTQVGRDGACAAAPAQTSPA
ncbi:ATP-binding cassette domain-containing protein [Chelatococcus reniformis]|uniref:Peptide ABC transporter ATP-binding protein n=1 Tax=Chelatococcus reniformis TaxID=1494448 RepID=A0A916XGU3_9HYPH|nr:ATP-binding cassette domain-containing protein [Chelatococcus reniformis]GGC72361.1 peptide ABC transporter ATP-binding protein [Chelatococcus reniformis]